MWAKIAPATHQQKRLQDRPRIPAIHTRERPIVSVIGDAHNDVTDAAAATTEQQLLPVGGMQRSIEQLRPIGATHNADARLAAIAELPAYFNNKYKQTMPV